MISSMPSSCAAFRFAESSCVQSSVLQSDASRLTVRIARPMCLETTPSLPSSLREGGGGHSVSRRHFAPWLPRSSAAGPLARAELRLRRFNAKKISIFQHWATLSELVVEEPICRGSRPALSRHLLATRRNWPDPSMHGFGKTPPRFALSSLSSMTDKQNQGCTKSVSETSAPEFSGVQRGVRDAASDVRSQVHVWTDRCWPSLARTPANLQICASDWEGVRVLIAVSDAVPWLMPQRHLRLAQHQLSVGAPRRRREPKGDRPHVRGVVARRQGRGGQAWRKGRWGAQR